MSKTSKAQGGLSLRVNQSPAVSTDGGKVVALLQYQDKSFSVFLLLEK